MKQRENKFRAWVNHVQNDYDWDSKQWSSSDRWRMAEVLTLHINKHGARCRYINEEGLPEVHNYDIGEHCYIMQFTGVKDKKGKDIYEGDIISHSGFQNPLSGEIEIAISVVELRGSTLCYVEYYAYEGGSGENLRYVSDLIGHLCDVDGDAEIIGNIHENPELLEP